MERIRWLTVMLMLGIMPVTLHASVKRDTLSDTTKHVYPKQGGNFSFGLRNTCSLFSEHTASSFGAGVGGHFRIQVTDRVNTEFFADVLTTNIKNKAHRTDYHFGWSVMFYLINPRAFNRKLTPYIVTGHCFDQTVIKINGVNGERRARFSSALQAGLGCHYNITPKFDISLCAQYMLHLGKELHTDETPDGEIEIEEHKNAGWEGHLLLSLSVNYKFLQLWKARR
ncbi:MAG TPA: hypothetical protein VK154_05095 [Chitinophagales bacterium]|nr:hypothetical protein [Chitinophagales bacterium]